MREAEAGPAPLLFRVVTGAEVLSVSVEFPYVAYECQVLYMQSVLDALFNARASPPTLSHVTDRLWAGRERAPRVAHRHGQDALPALRLARLEAPLFRQQRCVSTPGPLSPANSHARRPRPSYHILLAHARPGE